MLVAAKRIKQRKRLEERAQPEIPPVFRCGVPNENKKTAPLNMK